MHAEKWAQTQRVKIYYAYAYSSCTTSNGKFTDFTLYTSILLQVRAQIVQLHVSQSHANSYKYNLSQMY